MIAEPLAFDAAAGMSVADRAVLVTGGAHGIGLAIASAFAGAGARLGLLDLDAAGLDEASEALRSRSQVVTKVVDVRDWDGIRAAVDGVADELGGLDVVVNNAAVFPAERIDVLDPATFLDALDINLAGYARVAKAAYAHLLRSRAGRVINMGSITFLLGYPETTAYVASKGGVIGFTRALARELGPNGVTVNTVLPGAIPTRSEEDMADLEAFRAHVMASQCIKRRGSVDDIAATTLFLASDAASFITGQSLVVDGGWVFS